MPTTDPLKELRAELRADPPAGLAALSAEDVEALVAAIRDARAHQSAAIDRAFDGTLNHVPRLLRGAIRKALKL